MSSSRRPGPARRNPPPSRRSTPPPNRNQVLLVVISSLVICSLIGGVFVGLGASDIFGDLFSDDSNEQNYIDPNSDLISAQETVVAQSPDSVEDRLLLASVMANSGRLADAIPHYERALELAPDDVNARLSFARALSDGGMLADAELQFTRVLEMDPDNQQGHYYFARLLMALQPPRTTEAIEHYRQAASIDPTTLVGELAQEQLDVLTAGDEPEATPAASPVASPVG